MTTQNTIWNIENDCLIRYLGDDPHVFIPQNVRQICGNAFFSTAAKNIKFTTPNIILEEEAFRGSNISEIMLPNGIHRIENRTFAGCSSLKDVVLPNTVTYIGKQAFEGCKNLNGIILPDSLKFIDEKAFQNCGLIALTLPTGTYLIGNHAFYHCQNLKKIQFNNNLKSIGDFAFAECYRLNSIEFKDGLQAIGNNAFLNDGQLKKIVLPNTLLDLGESAFGGIKHINANIPLALKDHIEHYYQESLDPACYSMVFLPNASQIFDSTASITYR